MSDFEGILQVDHNGMQNESPGVRVRRVDIFRQLDVYVELSLKPV